MTCVILVIEMTLFTASKPVYPLGAGLIQKAKTRGSQVLNGQDSST
jgi:hypothetical protein